MGEFHMNAGDISSRSYEHLVFDDDTTDIRDIAQKVLFPHDRSPYQLGEHPIRNFQELKENLQFLSEYEATWVADWLEYLGDAETASNIYERPKDFRTMINERYRELSLVSSRAGSLFVS
jgi:hypothetical protein